MIVGVGTDMANIERIGRTLDKFGERFRTRVFTLLSWIRPIAVPIPKDLYRHLAKRWAAKEATSKAWEQVSPWGSRGRIFLYQTLIAVSRLLH